MKGKILALLGVGLILVVTILYVNNSREINFHDKENILEINEGEKFLAFIEEDKGRRKVKVYNKNTKVKEEIQDLSGDLNHIQITPNEAFLLVDSGEGLIKKTYIINTEDFQDRKELTTIGRIVISPDSKKLLIGVDNLKTRANRGEPVGTVDLVVYYLETGSIRVLLEADQYTDYEPIAWDENNNIKYRKIRGDLEEELSLKYEPPMEELLMEASLFNGKEDISKILDYMGQVDFDDLEDLYGEGSSMDFLDWLKGQEISQVEDIRIIINSVDNFFGKEYFLYIENLARIYIDYKMEFIKALAQVPEKLEDIGYALNYMKVYDMDGQDMWRDLNRIANSEELSEKEREIGMELIYFYSQCST